MQIIKVEKAAKVYVYSKTIHMGRSFPGLMRVIEEDLKCDVKVGDLFVFANKKLTYVKILFWSKGGPCILAKKLEHGTFKIQKGEEHLTIGGLQKLLENPEKIK